MLLYKYGLETGDSSKHLFTNDEPYFFQNMVFSNKKMQANLPIASYQIRIENVLFLQIKSVISAKQLIYNKSLQDIIVYYQLNRQKIFSLWLITVYNFSSSTTSNDFLPKGKHTFKFKSCTLTFQKLDKQMISLGYCNRFSDKFNDSFNKKQHHNFYWIYYALTLKPSRRNQKKEKT